MADDRLRVPVDDPYVNAVGLATICFARLEWDAVWCCEKMERGYINILGRKTAGMIASDLVEKAGAHPDAVIRQSLIAAAAEFKRLVGRRNDLMHAKPGTTPSGAQRLFRHGEEWTTEDVNRLADEFVVAGIPLNHHLHHLLS